MKKVTNYIKQTTVEQKVIDAIIAAPVTITFIIVIVNHLIK